MSKSPDTQKHTPGPWEAAGASVLANAGQVAQAFGPTLGESAPNARLIASAPELLQACQKALADLQDIYELADLPEQLRLNVVGSIGRLIGVCAKAEGSEVLHV